MPDELDNKAKVARALLYLLGGAGVGAAGEYFTRGRVSPWGPLIGAAGGVGLHASIHPRDYSALGEYMGRARSLIPTFGKTTVEDVSPKAPSPAKPPFRPGATIHRDIIAEAGSTPEIAAELDRQIRSIGANPDRDQYVNALAEFTQNYKKQNKGPADWHELLTDTATPAAVTAQGAAGFSNLIRPAARVSPVMQGLMMVPNAAINTAGVLDPKVRERWQNESLKSAEDPLGTGLENWSNVLINPTLAPAKLAAGAVGGAKDFYNAATSGGNKYETGEDFKAHYNQLRTTGMKPADIARKLIASGDIKDVNDRNTVTKPREASFSAAPQYDPDLLNQHTEQAMQEMPDLSRGKAKAAAMEYMRRNGLVSMGHAKSYEN
jgi:hypothetical protein